MNENGHAQASAARTPFPLVPFYAGTGFPPGAEVIDFQELLTRAGRHGVDLARPMRLEFHLIICARAGDLACSVDFTNCTVHPGSWLWVRPGQVLRFRSRPEACEGRLLAFPAAFLPLGPEALAHDGECAAHPLITPGPERHAELSQFMDMLRREYSAVSEFPVAVRLELMRGLVSVVVVHLAHLADSGRSQPAGSEAFHRFRRAVEEDFTRTHRVEDFTDRLGYSVRTLTRATKAAVGVGAKRYIDDRVLLEAQRLLVHTDLPPGTISESVGFTYPSVFNGFFRQRTGMTPSGFRSASRLSPGGDG
ncbi:helix-turn-helix transcriptional regulator [Streptomyces sp. NRRL F-5126]|uniref:helix-turn-helix transcriptional regulator n=1 Tax=Streptomyces sp. NRRL F-5126 TaxID=1463857 RepID=UPI0004C95667|nr:AraC family transcriptional regulator [Streptomyces sp. NRRL F-5126]